MRLRQLFEAKDNTVSIIFGRFNPPHKGHRAAWEMASESPSWYVGTNRSTQGPKDPLPFDVKVEAMKAIWPEVEGHIVAETSWLTLASKVYDEHGGGVTLLCLTDEDWVTKTIQQYNGKEGTHGYYNFKRIDQKPTPRLSSATALRAAVQADDRQAFADAAGVPADTPIAGHPFFDVVAHFLNQQTAAPKKVAKKKKEPEVAEEINIESIINNINQDAIEEGIKSKIAAAIIAAVAPAVAAQQPDQQIDPSDKSSISKILSTAITIYNIKSNASNISRAGAEEELRNELRRWINRQGGQYDQPSNLPLPDIRREDAAGVGIITKQNTTKDVNKGTLRKMLKAFHLIDSMSKDLKSLTEAPIELDPEDPMNPMIVGTRSNPAKLKYRMLRAANQLKDLAQRSQDASAIEWDSITKNFDELAMNIGEIKHALDELRKVRSKGGVRSRGIEKF